MAKSVVAVIEIGDLKSRCAISCVTDSEKNPEETMFLGFESHFHFPTYQLPTTILLNEKQEFEAYGYDAEIKYYNLCKNGNQNDYFYFKYFRLQFNKSNRLKTVKTYNGKKETSLKFLLSLIIRYFRIEILNCISKHCDITEDDIQWILPIPDEWAGYYENIFIQACYDAGLRHGNLSSIVESQAESTFQKNYSESLIGQNILVVDCGIRNIFPDYNFTDSMSADALFEDVGIWDFTPIDRILREIFQEITGKNIVHDDRISREERIDLYRKIQYKIGTKKCSFKIPLVWREEIEARLSNSNYSDKIRLVGDKLKFSDEFVDEIVQNALSTFLHKVQECIEENKSWTNCKSVGQYSGIPVIESLIKKTISTKYLDFFYDSRGDVASISKGSAFQGHEATLIRFSDFRFRLQMKNLELPLKTEKDLKAEVVDRKTAVLDLVKNVMRSNIEIPTGKKDYPFKLHLEPESIEDLSQHGEVLLLSNPKKQIHFTQQSKILENMCSLYENDWVNVLQELSKQGLVEVQCIEILLGILTEAYEECHRYIQKQTIQIAKTFYPSASTEELHRIVDGDSLSNDLLQSINLLRQAKKQQYILTILEGVLRSLESKFNLSAENINISADYMTENISNCWDMLCAEPLMYMKWKFPQNSKIDESIFQFYTKSGQCVCFVVWPVIYSAQSGQVLKRGIVQAK